MDFFAVKTASNSNFLMGFLMLVVGKVLEFIAYPFVI